MQAQLRVLAGERQVVFDLACGIQCLVDPDQIRQVLLNLFHNAVQHTDAVKGIIHISLHAAGELAELTVKDNGSGISAEHLRMSSTASIAAIPPAHANTAAPGLDYRLRGPLPKRITER